jgi:lysophospholipase L1-like esterase
MTIRGSFVAFTFVLTGLIAVPVSQAQTPQAPTAPPQAVAPLPTCQELAQAVVAAVRNDARIRDWANIARYREANAEVGRPAATEARAVFMGDSITDMWQQPRFGGFFPGKPYIDRGISGQTTPQMLVRFRRDVIDLAPKAVVILAGTNDIAGNTGPVTDEDIEGYLSAMAELATAHGIKVVLSSVLPVSEYHVMPNGIPQTTARPMARVRTVNAWLKQYAAQHGHVYLDYFSSMLDERGLLRAELSEDDLHPNTKGYAIMAPLAESAIAQALGKR